MKNKTQLQTIKNKVALLAEIEEALKAIYPKRYQHEFSNLINDGLSLEQINATLQNQLAGSSHSHKN